MAHNNTTNDVYKKIRLPTQKVRPLFTTILIMRNSGSNNNDK